MYSEDIQNCGVDHQKAIRQLAGVLLNRCAGIQPAEICTNSTHLLKIMREEHILLHSRIDFCEEFLREYKIEKSKPPVLDEKKIIAIV
jgi:hypothetical protein